jgi:hypothetical protein
MTKGNPREKRAPKKVVWWEARGPRSINVVAEKATAQSSPGCAELMSLRFTGKRFDVRLNTDLAAAETLHAELGRVIGAARARLAADARSWAAELVVEAAAMEAPPGSDPAESR